MIERLELRRDGRRLLTYGTSADADLVLKPSAVEGAATHLRRRARRPRQAAASAASAAGRSRCPASTMRSTRWRLSPRPAEAGIRDEVIRAALGDLLRRQAPLPAHRHLERRLDLRRLRSPPGRNRRRAQGRPGRRAWPRHRRGRAAPLFARARPLLRVLRLLQAMPTASSWRRSTRRASCRSMASIMHTLAEGIRAHRSPPR